MRYFLGLDCGTHGLTAIVVEDGDSKRVVFDHALEFDRECPEYGTENGVVRGVDGLEVTAPPLMWIDALDRMLAIVSREGGFDPKELVALSGSAQQHGTVYLKETADAVWRAPDPRVPIVRQLATIFSRDQSPVWMDSSTGTQCREIEHALGGPEAVRRLTGSIATERFAGPQIRKFSQEQPERYAWTDRIHLVSSFLASVLAGVHAPIDHGDGAGMNLMDIERLAWSAAALDATAPELDRRLPRVLPSWSIVGRLSSYWRERYGFGAAQVVAWSGDNPCSLVGTGLVHEGDLGVSLGTSDTAFAYTPDVRQALRASNVFGSPMGGYMGLLCFKNGSLARETVRDWFDLDWDGFSRALRDTPAGNGGALMLPWFEPEITPHVAEARARTLYLDAGDAGANVRAVVEGQMMAMANHSAALTGGTPRRILATGGASSNVEILQVMADVFGAEVSLAAEGNAACLGAALRAYHACESAQGRNIPWRAVVAGLTDPETSTHVAPIATHVDIYRTLRDRYAALERTASKTVT